MAESWESLRVGDRIRLVRMPNGYDLHEDTRRLYERLIERGRSLRIARVDELGLPWIECRFRLDDGTWEWHWLAMNDDSWVRVRPRRS